MTKFTREEVEETADNLEQEDLAGVDLSGADLNYDDLSGADLSGANLREANLGEAEYNKNTKFPEGFDPKAAGMVLVE